MKQKADQDRQPTVMDIMNQIDGVNLHEKRGGQFKFCLHMTKAMKETSLSDLNLGERAYNSLRRAGYNTVGDVAYAIAEGRSLYGIRNCGKKSVRQIMEQLFLYQYYSLPAGRRRAWLEEVVDMNRPAA